MASEHDARTRAFYDHESDEPAPARRRRAAADWGVNEDIFDRMPSRRFTRADRRAEHRDDPSPHFERRVSGPTAPRAGERADEAPRGDWSDEHERRQVAPRRPRRPAESWTAGDEGDVEIEGKRPIESWLEPERGQSRTIVLERSAPGLIEPVVEERFTVEAERSEPPGRKTLTITGHPDRLPVARTQRPPRTAIERIGASPDRIVGYAVLLGFLLIVIAVLTTGQ